MKLSAAQITLVIIGLMIVGGINTGLHVRDAHGLVMYDNQLNKAKQLCQLDESILGHQTCERVKQLN